MSPHEVVDHTYRSRSKSFYGRTKTSRTRSGCLCCRQRRVKCDEQRPSCQRCRDVGQTCVYGLKLTWLDDCTVSRKKVTPRVIPSKCQETGVRSRRNSEAGETFFLNTTWDDFRMTPLGNKRNMIKSKPDLQDQTDVSCVSQLPRSISYPRLDLSATEMTIFDFYTHRMCPKCRFTDGNKKRYRQVIIPISLESPLVLQSVLAVASNDMKYLDAKFEFTALYYQSTTLRSLSRTISYVRNSNEKSSANSSVHASLSKTEVLSIVLMLCSFEFANDNTCRPGSLPAWRMHLDGARQILELPASRFGGGGGDSSRIVTFLAGYLASHSILAYTTLADPTDAEMLLRGGSYWLTKIARPIQEIDSYPNCSNEVLSIILEICYQIRQKKTAMKRKIKKQKKSNSPESSQQEPCFCPSSLRVWKRNMEMRLRSVVQVHSPMFASSSMPALLPPSPSPSSLSSISSSSASSMTTVAIQYPPTLTTISRTAEAFRYAALILLQYLDPDQTIEDNPIVNDSVRVILDLMSAGVPIPPPGKSGRTMVLWPYFIAACHIRSDEGRVIFLRNFKHLEQAAATVSNNGVRFVRKVIEGVWKQHDLRPSSDNKDGEHIRNNNYICRNCIYSAYSDDDNNIDDDEYDYEGLQNDNTDADDGFCFDWEQVIRSLGYTLDWA